MYSEKILEKNGIAIGDIIHYSDKGYYRVIRPINRSPYVELQSVMSNYMRKTSNRITKLLAERCVKVTKDELVNILTESICLVETVFKNTLEEK